MSASTRGRVARFVAAAGAAAVATCALALPASGHATFPSSAAFDLQPNTLGGTGVDGAAPPYPAGTAQTLYLRVPDENSSGDLVDTNVAVNVIVPAGWTSPNCGQALTNVNTAETNNTNQPGDPVGGWTCSVQSNGSNQVLHYEGPAAASKDAGAQYFTFGVTVPSPSVQTTYNGAAGSGTEGFIVDQYYESGAIVHWYPDEAYPGTPPEGAESELSANLARTVAAAIPVTPVAPVTPEAPVSPAAAAVSAAPKFTG
jgi:hypothetical protein